MASQALSPGLRTGLGGGGGWPGRSMGLHSGSQMARFPPGGRGLAGAGSRVRDPMQPGVRTERVGCCGPCQGSVTPSETGQPSGRNPGPRSWTDASSGPAALSPYLLAHFLSIGASVPPSLLGANGSVYSKGSRKASMYTVNPVPVLGLPCRCWWRVAVVSLPSRFCRLWLWLV